MNMFGIRLMGFNDVTNFIDAEVRRRSNVCYADDTLLDLLIDFRNNVSEKVDLFTWDGAESWAIGIDRHARQIEHRATFLARRLMECSRIISDILDDAKIHSEADDEDPKDLDDGTAVEIHISIRDDGSKKLEIDGFDIEEDNGAFNQITQLSESLDRDTFFAVLGIINTVTKNQAPRKS